MPTKALSYAQKYRLDHPQDVREHDWRRGSASARGYDANWQRFREAWLTENPVCVFCGKLASIVDHIKPLSRGGARLDPHNVRSVDIDCHALLTANLKKTGRNEMPAGWVKP